jgi:Spy/CpxP family protein refolding chaperone
MTRSRFGLTVLLALLAAPLAAQGGGGQGNFAAMRMQAMLKDITLTAAQQSKVDSIAADYRGKMPAFTPGVRPDSSSRAQRREMMQHHDADIRAVLTAEQQPIWDRNAADMRVRMGAGGPRP